MPALCGCWACELCGIRRVAWLKKEIAAAIPRCQLRWFWTLTLRADRYTPAESFTVIATAWNRCRSALQKAHGKFEYVWTVEATAKGIAHLHLLVSLKVSAHELHDRWMAATRGSFGAKVKPVTDKVVSNYLAKYCVQQATLRRQPGWDLLKGKRLFSKSAGVVFEPFRGEGEGEWSLLDLPYWDAAAKLRETSHVLSERVRGVPSLSVAAVGVVR